MLRSLPLPDFLSLRLYPLGLFTDPMRSLPTYPPTLGEFATPAVGLNSLDILASLVHQAAHKNLRQCRLQSRIVTKQTARINNPSLLVWKGNSCFWIIY